jgi:hypothetical protein
LHAKRALSLADAALGVVTSASLAVSKIGHALAQACGLADKHAIKQVDRLLSNQGVQDWDLFAPWVRHAVSAREKIVVAIDWTDFDADNQTKGSPAYHCDFLTVDDAAFTAFRGREGRSGGSCVSSATPSRTMPLFDPHPRQSL